jgi:hypothetical protein
MAIRPAPTAYSDNSKPVSSFQNFLIAFIVLCSLFVGVVSHTNLANLSLVTVGLCR